MFFYKDGKHSVINEIVDKKVNIKHRMMILNQLEKLQDNPLSHLIANGVVTGPKRYVEEDFYRLHVKGSDPYRLPFVEYRGDYLILLLEPRHRSSFTITYDKAIKRFTKFANNQASYDHVERIDLSCISHER